MTQLLDKRSEDNLATLLEPVRPLFRAFVYQSQSILSLDGVTIKIISGNRSYEEQDALYAKGRTAPGGIVTRARGGYSNHNFRIAIDVGLFRGADYLEESPLYNKVVIIGRRFGFECGADWKSMPDEPHYNIRTGKTMAQLRADVKAGRSVLSGVALPAISSAPILPNSPSKTQDIGPTEGWLVVIGSQVLGVPYVGNGTAYLPARKLIEDLGKDDDPLGWDGKTLIYNKNPLPISSPLPVLRDVTGRVWGGVRGLADFCGYLVSVDSKTETIHLVPKPVNTRGV